MLSAVAALKPGDSAKFGVPRREEKSEVEVTPGTRPKPRQAQR
jgi:serine protease DegQ